MNSHYTNPSINNDLQNSRGGHLGSNYKTSQEAWNREAFDKEYALVNNWAYPFVYGDPNGYGSLTNPDPLGWGKPGPVTTYCGCGTSLLLNKEGYCSSCGTAQNYYQVRNYPDPQILENEVINNPDPISSTNIGQRRANKATELRNYQNTLLSNYCSIAPNNPACQGLKTLAQNVTEGYSGKDIHKGYTTAQYAYPESGASEQIGKFHPAEQLGSSEPMDSKPVPHYQLPMAPQQMAPQQMAPQQMAPQQMDVADKMEMSYCARSGGGKKIPF